MRPADKVEEKCPCVGDPGNQDWHMNSRTSWPLLKPIVGLCAPEFDAPNYRYNLFNGPYNTKVFPVDLPGRPYRPLGSASLTEPYVGTPDRPKYGADTTGGSWWPLHSWLNPASPDPRPTDEPDWGYSWDSTFGWILGFAVVIVIIYLVFYGYIFTTAINAFTR